MKTKFGLLNRDKQSAQIQYRKIVALNSPLANKLYAAMYENLLIVAAEK